MVTEGPVGDAMALRDAATLAARAPSMGEVVMGTAAGAAAVSVAGALATEVAERAESSLGIPSEKVSPFVHSVNERIAPAAHALDSFHEGVHNFTHEGDAKLEQLGNSISSFAAPVTQPIENAVNHVTHEAAKAAEPYTAPAAHAISNAFKPLGEALGHVKDSVEHFQAKALQEAVVFALEHRGSASLTPEEAHEVIKALAHVEKGDTLVIDNHSIHVVPAGSHTADVSHDALKLDADTLREGLGIARAPDHALANSQPAAPAPAVHAAAHEAQNHAAMEM